MEQINNKNSGNYNNNFPQIMSFTKENLAGAFKNLSLSKRKVLTIDNSGDSLLNAAFYGSRDLTLCNPNMLSNYYLYLKIAGLLTLNYNEFCWFFLKHNNYMHNNNRMFSKKLFKKISPMLNLINKEASLFFEELFDSNDNKGIRNNYFIDSNYHNKAVKNFNIYLRNENTYNRLRDCISNINYEFINKNIVCDSLDQKYDSIILSSLCTKMSLNKFLDLLKKLDSYNLSESGEMLLGYLWGKSIYTEDYSDFWKKVYNDPLENKYLKKYVTDCYEVSSYQNYLWEDNKREDKVLVYRK